MTSKTRRALARFQRAATVLAALCLTVQATATPGEMPVCEEQEYPPEVILIGQLVSADELPDPIDSVRTSFEVTDPDTGAEETYTLKVFSVTSFDPPTEAEIIATQTITVGTLDALPAGSVWIETPPVMMHWLTVPLEEPIVPLPDQAAFLFAIEMTSAQFFAPVRPHLEEVADPANTYSSDDGGCTWTLLDDHELDRLRDISGVDGSTYIRIRVRP